MIAYHGTIAGGLSVLKPFANPHSNLKYPCVYLSTNKALASIYIWNKAYKWMTFEIREDGMPVYNEMRFKRFGRFEKKGERDENRKK